MMRTEGQVTMGANLMRALHGGRALRAAIVLSALGATGWSATQKNPPNCSSRPCTYTITCATATCTAAEVQEVQAAIDDSQLGDTIRLEAGRSFTAPSNGIVVTRRPGTGLLTITTTGALPPAGTRITPHWRNQLPTLRNGGSQIALQIAGADSGPAEHIVVRGIRFAGCGQGLIRVGGSVSSDAGQPDDIVFDQILIENENWGIQCGTFIQANARRLWYRNSWAAGSIFLGGEKQSFTSTNGPGPLVIENNYLADNNGENIMFGGTGPTYRNLGISGVVRFNALINHEERIRYSPWQAGMVIFKGRVISPSSSGSPTLRALNSGVTGAVEPVWPTAVGQTVTDNGITWEVASTGTTHLTVKNNFEIKNAVNMRVHHNHLSGMWVDGQYENVVYKLANCPSGSGTNCQCVPGFSGLVNVNGTTVTSADGQRLPNIHQPTVKNGVDPFAITISGASYTISDFVKSDDFQLTLASSAGVQSNVPYTYGQSNCRPAWNKDTTFENNFVENGPLGFQIAQWTNGVRSQIGNIVVRNNLLRNIDPNRWSAWGGGVWNAQYYLWFAGMPAGVRFENNTVIASQNASRAGILLDNANAAEKMVLRNNIWPIAGGNGIVGGTPSAAEGESMLTSHLCDGSPCTTNEFDANIIAGVNKTRYTTGRLYNLCSTTSGCSVNFEYDDPVYGKLFQGYSNGIWKVRRNHFAERGDSNGRDIGADYLALPLIRGNDGRLGPTVEVTDRQAVFSYWLHGPMREINCSLEVSTSRDMDSLITDLDGGANAPLSNDAHDMYVREGTRRMIRVGVNAPLSPATTYWYRLHCGSVHEGSFTTAGSAASRTLRETVIAKTTGNHRLRYGNSYSRSTDAIGGLVTGNWVSCSAGAPCMVEANLAAGVWYYRVESASGYLWPVKVIVVK
jgi:hypothetical protein